MGLINPNHTSSNVISTQSSDSIKVYRGCLISFTEKWKTMVFIFPSFFLFKLFFSFKNMSVCCRWSSWRSRVWGRWLQTGLFTALWRWREDTNCRRTRLRPQNPRMCMHTKSPTHTRTHTRTRTHYKIKPVSPWSQFLFTGQHCGKCLE